MKYRINSSQKEQGVVSILSVIFFIILMSILTVSFLRVVTDEQEQVISDDLSKGALAAAQSGVEDAKRALLYCQRNPANPSCAALSNTACPGIFADAGLRNAVGINAVQADGIRVGDPNNNNNQRYTCVTISQDTPDYIGTMSEGLGDFIPLRTVNNGPYNQIRISWHQESDDVDGPAAVPPAGAISLNSNPSKPDWKNEAGLPYIAMPRLQLVAFDSAKTLSQQQNSSSGTFLVPYSGSGSARVPVTSVTASGMPKRFAVNCSTGDLQSGYLCTATLDVTAIPPADTEQRFLLVRSQYGTPHYKLELLNGATPVMLDNVQPAVDSTGAAANVYKRILSRVAYTADTFFTGNAVESGMSVCKNFYITATFYNNQCSSLAGDEADAQAVIGGYCNINLCIPAANADNGVRTPTWVETLANLTDVPRGQVDSCVWDFGDGTISTNHCYFGDTFDHTFPADNRYHTDDSLQRKVYYVKLTVTLKNGTRIQDGTKAFALPENYP